MSTSEFEQIKKILNDHYKERVDAHSKFEESLSDIQEKLNPVYEIYSQFKGFGNIALGFFKFVVIPVSIVMGILLSFKNLWK